MNIGHFNLDQHSDYDNRRSGDCEHEKPQFYQDIPRMILLISMIVFAFVGIKVNGYFNTPVRVVARSVGKGMEQSFRASIEGSSSITRTLLERYRIRQNYSPVTGIEVVEDVANTGNAEVLPLDARTALEALLDVPEWDEHKKEDMYGHGTRHFTGTFTEAGENGRIARVFEYWIDMKTNLPVRLTVSEVMRDPDFEIQENPKSLQTYLNIRYFGW